MKTAILIILLAMMLLLTCSISFADSYGIILPDKPSRTMEQAGKELQKYLNRMTFTSVAMNESAGKMDTVFILGDANPAASNLKVPEPANWSAEKSDAYYLKSIRSGGRNYIILAGKSDVSTLYAVYEYLERYGGCGEGPGYWGVAGACLFSNLELLHSATGGGLDIYDEPLVAEIGRYIVRMHIDDNYYVNFADGSARVDVEGSLIYRYGRSIGDESMMALGSNAFRRSNNLSRSGRWYSFTRVLPTLWDWEEILAYNAGLPYLRDVWMPGIQVMAAREQSGSSRGLYLAVKGGHNGESHNHNDVGNFIVYADGHPMLIDAGVETYTANTFNENRWKIWTMQSAYHNLPTVRGVMQPYGGKFHADDISYRCDDDLAELSLDIAGAYPEEAGIDKWQRTCRLHRGTDAFIEVVDDFSLKEQTDDITMSLLTAFEPDITGGELIVRGPDGPGIRVAFDSGLLSARVETIEIDDSRLSAVWGPRVYRVLLQPKNPVSRDTWRVILRIMK